MTASWMVQMSQMKRFCLSLLLTSALLTLSAAEEGASGVPRALVDGGRTVFQRMEPDAALRVRLHNPLDGPLSDVRVSARLSGDITMRVNLEAPVPSGHERVVAIPVDTSLRPATYDLTLTVSARTAAGEVESRQSSPKPLVIAPRPLPHVFPVIHWGFQVRSSSGVQRRQHQQ